MTTVYMVTQARADLAGIQRNDLLLMCGDWKEMDMTARHCRSCDIAVLVDHDACMDRRDRHGLATTS